MDTDHDYGGDCHGQDIHYTAEDWVLSDGSQLRLGATIKAHVSDIQVTLTDAHRVYGPERVSYWQRTALADWVGCHQAELRAQVRA